MRKLGMFPMFEMPEGGGGEPAVEPAGDPAPAGEPAAVEPSWSGPGQDEWARVTQFIEQSAPTLGMLGELLTEPEGQTQQPVQLDPNNPESLAQYLDSRVEAMFNERVAPFQPLLGQIAEREGEQAARSRLDELAGTVGNFDRDQALVTAQVLLSQGLAPEQALEQAARRQFDFETKFREAAFKEYQEKLGAAATAQPGAPAAPGAAVEGLGVPKGRDRYEEALARGLSAVRPATESQFA